MMDPADDAAGARGTARRMGEIMFRGNITMKGYLRNPTATEEAFAGGWFHTGDLAVHASGRLHQDQGPLEGHHHLGRREHLVARSRGRDVPPSRRCSARRWWRKPDEKWGETPCAFVELKPGAQATRRGADRVLPRALARFKVPEACRVPRAAEDLDRQDPEVRAARGGEGGRQLAERARPTRQRVFATRAARQRAAAVPARRKGRALSHRCRNRRRHRAREAMRRFRADALGIGRFFSAGPGGDAGGPIVERRVIVAADVELFGTVQAAVNEVGSEIHQPRPVDGIGADQRDILRAQQVDEAGADEARVANLDRVPERAVGVDFHGQRAAADALVVAAASAAAASVSRGSNSRKDSKIRRHRSGSWAETAKGSAKLRAEPQAGRRRRNLPSGASDILEPLHVRDESRSFDRKRRNRRVFQQPRSQNWRDAAGSRTCR